MTYGAVYNLVPAVECLAIWSMSMAYQLSRHVCLVLILKTNRRAGEAGDFRFLLVSLDRLVFEVPEGQSQSCTNVLPTIRTGVRTL